MIEPPSQELAQRLFDLRLCAPRDLRRCRKRVKRLAYDLPAFDSVWIDALVQAGRLSPFQARILEAGDAQQLQVGPCVLVDQLGQGPASTTYLARQREGNQRCVLKLLMPPSESPTAELADLRKLVADLDGLAHPSLVAPKTCLQYDRRLVTVSRYVPGLPLNELLVRRGRFPAGVVREIARQLLDALAALEQRGYVHGDIRLSKVRMTSAGTAVLVDAGIRPAVHPELTIHAGLPPEYYDGVAPELIGTGNTSSAASELYALGCLCWQLLAGRPPFPTGDPLGKLAAHQTRTIPDVRDWAPDTPAPLAGAIREWTARDPTARPQTIRDVRERWGKPTLRGRRRLAKFRASFNTAVTRVPEAVGTGQTNRWPFLVACLFVLTGLSLTLLDEGARGEFLRLASRSLDRAERAVSGSSSADERSAESGEREGDGVTRRQGDKVTTQRGELVNPSPRSTVADPSALPLPPPNPDGVIKLTGDGPYETAEITQVGKLVIRGEQGSRPQIVIRDKSLHIRAAEIVLQNVHVRRDAPAASNNRPSAMILAEAQNVTVRSCSFRTPRLDASPAESSRVTPNNSYTDEHPVALAWKTLDAADRSGRVFVMEDTVFSGTGPAVYCNLPPRKAVVANCLKLGRGSLVTLAEPPTDGQQLRISLERVTLRRAGSLLRVRLPPDRLWGPISLEPENCVFDVRNAESALLALVAPRIESEQLEQLSVSGQGSVAPPEVVIAAQVDPENGDASALSPTAVQAGGIAAGAFTFAGPLSRHPADAAVTSCDMPRLSAELPGIKPARLTLPRGEE